MEDLIIAVQSLGQKDFFDYIQLAVSLVSIIISVVAIVFAVRVPKQIAKQQNKIALLDKRIDVFMSFSKLFQSSIGLVWFGIDKKGFHDINLFYGDIANLFATFSFLFSPELDKEAQDLYNNYKEIYWGNQKIDYIVATMEESDQKKIEDIIQDLQVYDHISKEKENELKKLSERNGCRYEEEQELIYFLPTHNYVCDLSDKIKTEQKEFLRKMKMEIDMYDIESR